MGLRGAVYAAAEVVADAQVGRIAMYPGRCVSAPCPSWRFVAMSEGPSDACGIPCRASYRAMRGQRDSR